MFTSLAHFCVRHRKFVVFGIWIPLFIAVGALSNAVGNNFDTDFVLPKSEAREVRELLTANNPNQAGFTGQVVYVAENGFDDAATVAAIENVVAELASIKGLDTTGPFNAPGFISKSGTIAFTQIDISDRPLSEMKIVAKEVKKIGNSAESNTLRVEFGGQMFTDVSMPESEALGVIAAIVILVLAFGSILAMGLPIGTALLGLGVGVGVATLVSNLQSMPDFTTSMMAMIGLGVGIDYALFIVTRYREGLHDGLGVEESVAEALDTSGRAVVFAGITVIISLLGLYLMGLNFVRGLATGTAIGVFVMMIASITLLPALLAMVGTRIDTTSRAAMISLTVAIVSALVAIVTHAIGPLLIGVVLAAFTQIASIFVKSLRTPLPHRTRKPHNETFWFKWSRYVQHRPWRALTGAVTVLVILTVPLFSIRLGFGDTGNYPKDATVRKAYDLLAEGFGPGFNGPLLVAVPGEAGASAEGMAPLVNAFQSTKDVNFVRPIPAAGDSTVGMILIYPTTAPQDERTTQLVHKLRDDVIPSVGADAKVGGFVAASIDFADFIGKRLPYLMAAVLFLSFILLMAVFRSLLVPLKAVVMNLLSIGSAYGVIVAIFQWGWGKDLIGVGKEGPIEAWIPMMLFAIVFGLSMDYEVFLLSRIKEEYDHTRNNAEAVANGLAATARVITAAALIMVSVFSAFVLGDDRQMKLFGLGMAIAVFVDATIVRMILVPATMELLGNRNWWIPKWLDKLLPKIDVEGHSHTWEGDQVVVDNSKTQ